MFSRTLEQFNSLLETNFGAFISVETGRLNPAAKYRHGNVERRPYIDIEHDDILENLT